MLLWQVHIQRTTIWSSCSRQYVPEKKDKIFKELPNVLGFADDILVVGYNSNEADHDKTLCRALQICRKEKLKFNKDKCNFRCTSLPLFDEIISRHGVRPDPRN